MPEPSPFEIGVQVGGVHDGQVQGTGYYVGGSFITRVRNGDSPVRLQIDVNVRVGGEGSKWHTLVNLTTRPFGRDSPLYVGMGGGISKRDDLIGVPGSESIAAHHSVLAGLSFDLAGARPIVEAQLLDPFQPSRTAFGFRLGTRFLLRP